MVLKTYTTVIRHKQAPQYHPQSAECHLTGHSLNNVKLLQYIWKELKYQHSRYYDSYITLKIMFRFEFFQLV